MRRAALALGGVLVATSLAGCSDEPPPLARGGQPNILLVVADDLGWADVGCYAGAPAWTPRLDALAGQGVRCTDFYAAAPICSPSRASLLTGRTPERHGLRQALLEDDAIEGLDRYQPLLPEYLQGCGYTTALVGKWHLGAAREYRPRRRGFDEFFGMLQASSDYWHHRFRGEPDLWQGDAPVERDGIYSTELFTAEAVAFLERQAGAPQRRPWFLMLAYNAPHRADDRVSLPAPERWTQQFAALDLPQPRKDTLAAVAALDEGIGQVLDALGRLRMEADTLVIVISDNGPPREPGSTSPLRGEKDTLDEGGIRVPCLVRWPGRLPAGAVCAEPLSAIDLAPTLLADACVEPPRDVSMDGLDILPALAGRSPSPHETLFWSHRSLRRDFGGERAQWSAVRQGRWRLTLSPDGGTELHDLAEDPGQTRDRAAERPDLVGQLSALLERHEAEAAVWAR